MQKKTFEKIDLTFYKEKLENGLEVYIVPKEGNNIYATFTSKYGSSTRDFIPINKKEEIKVVDGIAHFLEHLVFEQEDGINPFDFYAERGADSNAATSQEKTTYMFSSVSSFKENLNYLLDFVQSPYFTDENVESEKGIIKEELTMYKDDPYNTLYEESLLNSFDVHPIRIPIGGTIDSIMKITKEMLYTCYDTFYHPSNMFVVITGNINPEETISMIKENQKNKSFKKSEKIKVKKYKEPDQIKKENIVIKKNVTLPKVSINFKINISSLKGIHPFLIYQALNHLFYIKLGPTSLSTEKLKEEGIITDGLGLEVLHTDTHYLFMVLGESKKPTLLIEKIKEVMKDLKINEEDLERKKKVLISSSIFMSDNIFAMNNKVTSNIISYGEIVDDNEYIKKLDIKLFNQIISSLDFSNICSVTIDKVS